MMSLGLPHINVLSKCDLYPDKEKLDSFISMDNTPLTGPIDLDDESHIQAFNRHKGDVEKVFEDPKVVNSSTMI